MRSSTYSSLEFCLRPFDSVHELRNGERFKTGRTNTMCVSNGPDVNSAKNSLETDENEEADIRSLTKEVKSKSGTSLATHKTARSFDLACPRIIDHIASKSLPKGGCR